MGAAQEFQCAFRKVIANRRSKHCSGPPLWREAWRAESRLHFCLPLFQTMSVFLQSLPMISSVWPSCCAHTSLLSCSRVSCPLMVLQRSASVFEAHVETPRKCQQRPLCLAQRLKGSFLMQASPQLSSYRRLTRTTLSWPTGERLQVLRNITADLATATHRSQSLRSKIINT